MGNRMKHLYELDKLFEKCNVCTISGGRNGTNACNACNVYKEIRNIGKELEKKKGVKKKVEITPLEYIDLRYRSFKDGKEIAEKFKLSLTKLNNWIKKNQSEIETEYDLQFGPLTESEKKVASNNGISEELAMNRINFKLYDRNKAVTQSIEQEKKDTAWKELEHLAKERGVSYNAYVARLYKGMSPMEAALMANKRKAN